MIKKHYNFHLSYKYLKNTIKLLNIEIIYFLICNKQTLSISFRYLMYKPLIASFILLSFYNYSRLYYIVEFFIFFMSRNLTKLYPDEC